MTNKKLKPFLIASVLASTILSLQVHADDKNSNLLSLINDTGGNITYHLMSEDELLMQLNDQGKKTYESLSPEGKLLARKMASRSCNGTNECAGENACRSDNNKCAGEGTCRGKGICAFADKNLAVKLAAKKMASKRHDATK